MITSARCENGFVELFGRVKSLVETGEGEAGLGEEFVLSADVTLVMMPATQKSKRLLSIRRA